MSGSPEWTIRSTSRSRTHKIYRSQNKESIVGFGSSLTEQQLCFSALACVAGTSLQVVIENLLAQLGGHPGSVELYLSRGTRLAQVLVVRGSDGGSLLLELTTHLLSKLLYRLFLHVVLLGETVSDECAD